MTTAIILFTAALVILGIIEIILLITIIKGIVISLKDKE